MVSLPHNPWSDLRSKHKPRIVDEPGFCDFIMPDGTVCRQRLSKYNRSRQCYSHPVPLGGAKPIRAKLACWEGRWEPIHGLKDSDVIEAVTRKHRVPYRAIFGPDLSRNLAGICKIASYLLRYDLGLSTVAITRLLQKAQNHVATGGSLEIMRRLKDKDNELQKLIDRIRRRYPKACQRDSRPSQPARIDDPVACEEPDRPFNLPPQALPGVTPEDIKDAVAKVFQIPLSALNGKRAEDKEVLARYVLAYLLRFDLKMSLYKTTLFMCRGRNKDFAVRATEAIRDRIDSDPDLRGKMHAVRALYPPKAREALRQALGG